jgi:hypothetical protein
MYEQKIRFLLNAIEEKGYIGAGPINLVDDQNWMELRALFAIANMPKPTPKPTPKKEGKK